MNYNKDYWDNFYSRYDELPSAPSNFALFVLRFLQERYPPKKKIIKTFLISAVETEEIRIFFCPKVSMSLG